MNWEEELHKLFDDTLLEDVRQVLPQITCDDRLVLSFNEINKWFEENKEEPKENESNFAEKILYRRLKNLRNDLEKKTYLKSFDKYNLLD